MHLNTAEEKIEVRFAGHHNRQAGADKHRRTAKHKHYRRKIHRWVEANEEYHLHALRTARLLDRGRTRRDIEAVAQEDLPVVRVGTYPLAAAWPDDPDSGKLVGG